MRLAESSSAGVPPLVPGPAPACLAAARVLASVWRPGLLRVARALRRRLPSPCLVERPLFGQRLILDVSRSDVHTLLYLEGERFIEERHLVRRLVEGRRGIVDVGANIGYYLLLFARHAAPDSPLVCIEPSGENLPELEANTRLNGLARVALHPVALGAAAGEAGLRTGLNSGVTAPGEGAYRVRVAPLDDLLDGPVEFVKIDVEGYEYEVLKGARRTLASRPALFLELHPRALRRFGASVTQCVELLREFYPEVRFHGGEESLASGGSPRARRVRRAAALYAGIDTVRPLDLRPEQLRALDDDPTWGTFWAVCDAGRRS